MKYFTKYLPVEGDIKSHDTFSPLVGVEKGAIHECMGTDEGYLWCYVDGEEIKVDPGDCQKMQLFLCSNDIHIGDRVRALDTPHLEFEWTDKDLGGAALACSVQLYFKVLGPISDQAKWVKEYDEFEENDMYIRKNESIKLKGLCGHFH